MNISRTHTNRRMSQAVSFGPRMKTVVLAGQVVQAKSDSIAAQTRDILERIDQSCGDMAQAGKTSSVPLSGWRTLATLKP